MNELENLLQDPKLKHDLQAVLKKAASNFHVTDCFWAVRNIESQLNSLTKEAKAVFTEEFGRLFLQIKWVALPRLKPGEILDLLERHLLAVKEFEPAVFNLTQTVRAYLLGIINYSERDQFKTKVRASLLNNQEVLGNLGQDKTISQWLREVISQVGPELDNRLKEAEFYLKNKDFISLPEIDRWLLKQAISLYKYCLYSSQSPEGLDEPLIVATESGTKIVEFSQIMDVPPLDKATMEIIREFSGEAPFSALAVQTAPAASAASAASAQNLFKQYKKSVQDLFENFQVKTQAETLAKLSIPEIIWQFVALLQKAESSLVLAGLLSLIKRNGLTQLETTPLFKEWQANFLKNYPTLISINLTSPEQRQLMMSRFIRDVLQKQGNLAEQQSAMAMVHLANLLKSLGQPGYLAASYADLKTASWCWREIEVVDGKLKYKP